MGKARTSNTLMRDQPRISVLQLLIDNEKNDLIGTLRSNPAVTYLQK